MLIRFKSKIFVHKELEEDYQYNRQQLRHDFVQCKSIDTGIKDQVTQKESCKTDTKEYAKATACFILHLEIVITTLIQLATI